MGEFDNLIKYEKKKNNNWIIVILIIIIILLGSYIAYDKYFKERFNLETKDTVQEEIQQEEIQSQEKEITDQTIINILDKNTKAISSESSGGIFIQNLYEKDIMVSNLSTEEKMFVALKKSIPENEYDTGTITKNDFTTSYYNLFGKETINYTNISGCPFANYDKTREVFNFSYHCGGGSSYGFFKYNYKYTNKDNNYYVYQSFAISNAETQKIEDIDGKTYSDLKDNFKITEENYQDFSAYKWTYEKEDNYYVFKSVERIK